MVNYYGLDIIPIILNRFKVNEIIMSGLSEKNYINQFLQYCEDNGASFIAIDSYEDFDFEYIDDYILNVLPNLSNYDAIFLNDDPNWYTVYNELNIIKESNDEFPLVFIGHNKFPNKFRDSYINPNIIPKEFLNEFSDRLQYKNININDGFFHAIYENTPKNGVLTAIKDFLNENTSIGIMDYNFLNGMVILYEKNSINQIRLGLLNDEIKRYAIDYNELFDDIFESQFLMKYVSEFINEIGSIPNLAKEIKEKDKIIIDYENQIKLHDVEINYKDSQISNFSSKLSLKDSEIENIKSKLFNRENEITDLYNQVNYLNRELLFRDEDFKNKQEEFNNKMLISKEEINSLKIEETKNKEREYELNNQLKKANEEINYQIKVKEEELNKKNSQLNSIKYQYESQFSKIDNKDYCITCYKEEISNNHLEIKYLKKNNFIKLFLKPLSYIYLFLKSNRKDLTLNFKLYKLLRNNECFDEGYYLNHNEDLIDGKFFKYFSLELHYVCHGFKEKRKFNKKYFNLNSKKELIDYISKCK